MSDLYLKEPVDRKAWQARSGVLGTSDFRVDAEFLDIAKHNGNTPIFEGVSFRFALGEAVALMGANGTEKSTLLRCLMGLIPVQRAR